MQQFADSATESPAGSRQFTGHVFVSSERRDDEHETEVGNSEIQQQNINDSAHAHARHYDDDDERVSGETEQSDGGEENGNDDSLQCEPVDVVACSHPVICTRTSCFLTVTVLQSTTTHTGDSAISQHVLPYGHHHNVPELRGHVSHAQNDAVLIISAKEIM